MLRVVETFSGIGSQAKALKNAQIEHEILATVEWDINAIYAYDLIHNGKQKIDEYQHLSKDEVIKELSKLAISNDGKSPLKPKALKMMSRESLLSIFIAIERTKNLINITEVNGNHLPQNIDVLTYSFPCQDLSICGLWHGNVSGIKKGVNNRSGMLWEIERILFEIKANNQKLPKFLLMENVTNILSERHRDDFQQWQDYLANDLGYFNRIYTLNSKNFGIPQNRRRTFMLSVHKDENLTVEFLDNYFKENNLENNSDEMSSLKNYLRLDYDNLLYRSEALKSCPNNTPSRLKILNENIVLFDGIDTYGALINTLTTKQDRNPNSGIIRFDGGAKKSSYRNLTPRECFLLMGFSEEDFQILCDYNVRVKKNTPIFSQQKLIKLAGNSIVVKILESIFIQIDDLNKFRKDK